MSKGGDPGLRVFHDDDLTGLCCMRPDDGHVGILPDIAGCLSPLSEEQHSVPLEGRVGGGCEVQVTLTDLNRQTVMFSINKQQQTYFRIFVKKFF